MIQAIGQWSHALAALLFTGLSVWQAQRRGRTPQTRVLLLALVATAFWALIEAIEGPRSSLSIFAESARNLAWLGFMFVVLRRGETSVTGAATGRRFAVAAVYGVLALVLGAQILVDLLPPAFDGSPRLLEAIFYASIALRMTMAVGALVLVHNLYSAAAPDARWGIRLPMIALAAMWTYDLNLYTVTYLANAPPLELFAVRGFAMALLAPILGLAARRNDKMKMRLSRTVAFQTFSLVAIGGYLVVMVLVTSAFDYLGGNYARTAQISFVFGTSVAAMVLLPSGKFRAWFKVKIAKHLFQHRYDYREEWMRFTDTIGRPGDDAAALDVRVIQAVADITESPGGLLMVPDGAGGLALQARWNWASAEIGTVALGANLARQLEENGRIIEIDALRRLVPAEGEAGIPDWIPAWIGAEPRAWAMVPLVHFNRLAGVVLLERPRIDRTLDWEDFDLLRVVGRQVASYLSEARGQEALSEAKRFDEFNRRFAFIMHDIKNLVSQLSLVSRNAERHADNPEFRVDMIATLKDSTQRLNDLLARLSQHHKGKPAEPRPVAASAVVEAVAAPKRALHPIAITGHGDLLAFADPARMEQIIGHLVQNAIDASASHEPVHIGIGRQGLNVAIEILDRGCGMSAEFVRNGLFKPFASTKDGGFGVGAFEARALASAMGGRIEVESREGEGSRFTLLLPLATPEDLAAIRDRAA